MSAVSGGGHFREISSSTANEGTAPKSHRLFTWGTAAVSVGLLAAGVFFAAYCSSPSDENSGKGDASETGLATRTTSLAQDMALIVSAGIMPFFGLVGASFHVFREEKNRNLELFSADEERQQLADALMTMDDEKLKSAVKRSYRAGRVDRAASFIPLISQTEDRDHLCEELVHKSNRAGRFDESEKFMKLMSHGARRQKLCRKLAEKHYDAGRFDEAARFIQLIPGRQMRHVAFEELANRSFYLERFDEAEKFIQLISTQPEYDSVSRDLAERSYLDGRLDLAERFVRLMSESKDRDVLLGDLAKYSYRNGHPDQTEKFIQLMRKSESRDLLLGDLATKSYRSGRFNEARKFIQLIHTGRRRLYELDELEKKSSDAGLVDEALEFSRLMNEELALGHVFLDRASSSCRNFQLDEAAISIRALPDSYDPSKYFEIDELAENCFERCKTFSVIKGKSADQKYLEFVHSIPNAPLRELLREKLKDVRQPDLIPDCMDSENCSALDLELLPSRAIEAVTFLPVVQAISEGPIERKSSRNTDFEMLRFRHDDPREKVLFGVAVADDNGALKPFFHERVLRILDSKYDLKYQMLSDEQILCDAIQSGAKTGRLSRIYMHAHGLPTLMRFGRGRFGVINQASDLSSCFSGLPEDLIITLFSCLTGSKTSDGTDPFAQTIADQAKKTVIAATEIIYEDLYEFSLSEELFHPSELDDDQNSFVTFHPRK